MLPGGDVNPVEAVLVCVYVFCGLCSSDRAWNVVVSFIEVLDSQGGHVRSV